MSRKQIIIILSLVVVLIAAGVAAFLFHGGQDSALASSAQGNDAGLAITAADHTLGNPKAAVTVVEYGAPTCSICANFNAQTFGPLKKAYIDTGKIFYVFRVFPLRPDDGAVEKMALCLPEDKYFSFIDLMWRNQPKWDAAEYPGIADVHAQLVQLGRVAGMSGDQVDKCIANKAEDDRINKISAQAETKYNITGTPTFVIDGIAQPSGAIPFDQFSKLLDAELAKKK